LGRAGPLTRPVTAAAVVLTVAGSLSCFGPCLATAECCSGPSAVRAHSDDALQFGDTDVNVGDTDEVAERGPTLAITLTGSEEGEVVREVELLPDGAGGYLLAETDLDLEHQCSFEGTLRFELEFPPTWTSGGRDLEPVEVTLEEGFSADEVELWNGWSVQVEILYWMA
jgi:hypothetical protein